MSDSTFTPATFGGPGFQSREGTLASDITAGRWGMVGVDSETGPLRAVLLSVPGPEHENITDPDRWLMLEAPSPARLSREAKGIAQFFGSHGITVHRFRPGNPAPPNLLFMRDLFLMTPEGAILARMGAEQRAGEERHATAALAALGSPILHTVHGQGTFEGADALWLAPDRVVVGTGQRTNAAGLDQVRGVLARMKVDVVDVALPEGTQHLQGVFSFLRPDLAVVHGGRITSTIRGVLAEAGFDLLELPPGPELDEGRSMNIVTLGPGEIVMPSDCPETAQRYEDAGIKVHTLPVGEYIKAAGALGCLTGILRRDPIR